MDALIFSNKLSPNDETIQWYEWIVDKHPNFHSNSSKRNNNLKNYYF